MLYQKILSSVFILICTYTDICSKKIYKGILAAYLFLSLAGHMAGCLVAENCSVTGLAIGMIPGVFCLLLSFLTRQGIGYGDSILIMINGLSLGAEVCLHILLTALFWAGIWGMIQWRFFNKDKKTEIPFVPFLLIGLIIQLI